MTNSESDARASNEQDINTALAWLEGPWQAAENRRGAANAAAVIRALRDAHETPPASNSNDMAAEFQRWLNAKGGDKGLMAAFYAGYMIAIRGSHETVEQRDGPSTCRQEGHDWKVTCSDCGEVRPIPYVHLNSGGHDRDAKIYSVRDVEALLAVGEAMSRHAPAQKANSCVCGEPNSPGTHRTDGPCLAPIGDHHP